MVTKIVIFPRFLDIQNLGKGNQKKKITGTNRLGMCVNSNTEVKF